MLENCVVFTSLIQLRSSKKPFSKMRVENWKFQCQLQCPARSGEESTRKLVALLMLARQNNAWIVEADESTRKRLEGTLHKDYEDHIAGKVINSLNLYNLVHKFILMRQAMKIPDAKAAVSISLEELRNWEYQPWYGNTQFEEKVT